MYIHIYIYIYIYMHIYILYAYFVWFLWVCRMGIRHDMIVGCVWKWSMLGMGVQSIRTEGNWWSWDDPKMTIHWSVVRFFLEGLCGEFLNFGFSFFRGFFFSPQQGRMFAVDSRARFGSCKLDHMLSEVGLFWTQSCRLPQPGGRLGCRNQQLQGPVFKMFQGKRAKPKTTRPSNDQHSCSQIAALGSKWETITGFTNECGTHRWVKPLCWLVQAYVPLISDISLFSIRTILVIAWNIPNIPKWDLD